VQRVRILFAAERSSHGLELGGVGLRQRCRLLAPVHAIGRADWKQRLEVRTLRQEATGKQANDAVAISACVDDAAEALYAVGTKERQEDSVCKRTGSARVHVRRGGQEGVAIILAVCNYCSLGENDAKRSLHVLCSSEDREKMVFCLFPFFFFFVVEKNSNNVWYHMDDDLVRQVQEQTVLNQSPYVLFYVKNVPTLVHAPPSSVSTQSGVSRQVSVLPPVATVPPAGNAAPPKNAFEVMLSSQKREGPVHAVPLSEQSKKKKKKKKKNKKKKKKDGERIAFVQGKPANANQGVPANVSVSEKSVGPLTEAETIAAAAPTSSSVEKPKDFVEKPKDFVEKPKDFVEKSLEKPVTMELPAAAAESKHNTVGILSEVFSHLKDRAAAAAAAAPFAVPRSKPTTATLVDEKSVSALMQRSQSVADFLAWEETDVATKKIAILQTAVKEKAAARKRESKFDPELDKGKVKKLKSKLKVEESFVPRAAFDSAARHRKLNKSSERPKQQKLKQLKLKFKQKFI
jgi:hypothetical protein